jgi:hypothetical protein
MVKSILNYDLNGLFLIILFLLGYQNRVYKSDSLTFSINQIKKKLKIYRHQLIANIFVSNPKNYPVINHKNHDTTDNKANNLEWCTYQYNAEHGNGLGCSMVNTKDNTKKNYTSLAECAKDLNSILNIKYLNRAQIRYFIDHNVHYKFTYKFYLDESK